MTPDSTQNPTLPRLLAEFFDGALSDADHALLADALRDNPHAQQLYLDYCWTHALLRQELGGAAIFGVEKVTGGEWQVASDIHHPKSQDLKPKTQPPYLQPPTLHPPLSTLHYWAFSYSVATVFLALFLLGSWSYTITHPDADSLAVKNSRSAAPSGSAANTTPEFTFVGRISGMVDCQWAEDASATSPGAGVALNRRYALKSGLMEITYDSGAKVILQGPCDYKVESPRGGFLKIGKLVARVGEGPGVRGQGSETNLPSPARGRGAGGEGIQPHMQSALTLALSQGERGPDSESRIPEPRTPNPPSPISKSPNLQISKFLVRTPTALVEDLGTEFGVEVIASGETSSHVFQGQVRVRVEGAGNLHPESPNPRIPNPELILSAGQSVRVEKDKTSGALKLLSGERAASSAKDTFVRRLPHKPTMPVDVAARKTIVKWSGVYRYGDPTKATSDWTTLERFGTWHVNDGKTDEMEQGYSYWLGRERTEDEYFIIYLAGRFDIERIELVNTHNGSGNDRGTRDFEIWAADAVDQDNELVAPRLVLKGVLPCRFDAGAEIPADVFSTAAGDFKPFNARYVKFVAKTYYEGAEAGGCGLNEIRLFAGSTSEQASTEQGQQ
jgi:hypothetical protein